MKNVFILSIMLGFFLLTGCNSIEATVREYIDAYSDHTPRTIFYFAIPADYIHSQRNILTCSFSVLYSRNGKVIWPDEFNLLRGRIGSDVFYAVRWTPEYRKTPVFMREEICLVSPEKGDQILVLVSRGHSGGEIRYFSIPFDQLPDFNGKHVHRQGVFPYSCILDRGPFTGVCGNRFPQKSITLPVWEKLSPLPKEAENFYRKKFAPVSDSMNALIIELEE